MSGLITTRPASIAIAIWLADQSAHRSSPVMTSSSTHESTRVAERIAVRSFATEQRHDLVGAHARYFLTTGRVAQPADQPLPSALGPLSADDLQRAGDLDDLHLIPGVQPVLGPQMRRDGHLAFAVQHHHDLPRMWPVLLLLRSSITRMQALLAECAWDWRVGAGAAAALHPRAPC